MFFSKFRIKKLVPKTQDGTPGYRGTNLEGLSGHFSRENKGKMSTPLTPNPSIPSNRSRCVNYSPLDPKLKSTLTEVSETTRDPTRQMSPDPFEHHTGRRLTPVPSLPLWAGSGRFVRLRDLDPEPTRTRPPNPSHETGHRTGRSGVLSSQGTSPPTHLSS